MGCGAGWDWSGIPPVALPWFPIVAGSVALATRLFRSSGKRGAEADRAPPIRHERHARGEVEWAEVDARWRGLGGRAAAGADRSPGALPLRSKLSPKQGGPRPVT